MANVLKTHAEVADIPIIAVAAYAMAGDKKKVLAASATEYIGKPIKPEIFVDGIRQHMP